MRAPDERNSARAEMTGSAKQSSLHQGLASSSQPYARQGQLSTKWPAAAASGDVPLDAGETLTISCRSVACRTPRPAAVDPRPSLRRHRDITFQWRADYWSILSFAC